MWTRYFRLLAVALFVWIAVLGLKAGSIRFVIFPLLALGALLIAQEILRESHPEIGRTLSTALSTLVILYNLYITFPRVRSWFESRFPESTTAAERREVDMDLQTAGQLDPPALEARKALHQYLLQKEDILGRKIKSELDALNAKRQQGTFGPEDEKREKEVLRQFQKLVQDRRDLQQVIAGTWAEQLTRTQPIPSQPSPIGSSQPQLAGTPATGQFPAQIGTQPPSDPPTPQNITPLSYSLTPTNPVQSQPSEYEINLQQCIRQSESIHCWGYVKNLTDGKIKLRMNHSYSTYIDDEGNAGQIIGVVQTEYPISGVPVKYDLDFHDSHVNVRSLSFEIKVELEGDPSPRIRYDSFSFKDVPLQTAPGQLPVSVQPSRDLSPDGGSPPEYSFVIKECARAKEKIGCWGLMTNKTDASVRVYLQDSRAFDDEGNSFFIGSCCGAIAFSGGANSLLPSIPLRFTISVDDPHQSVKLISLDLGVQWSRRYDRLTFKNLSVH